MDFFSENLHLLKLILLSKKIKYIVLEINEFNFETERPFPEELYGESNLPRYVNKLKTLFSLQEFFVILHSVRRENNQSLTRDGLYSWEKEYKCNEKVFAEYLLNNYSLQKVCKGTLNKALINKVENNINTYLIPFLDLSKDVQILAFFPPLHIMKYGENKETSLAIKKMQSDILLRYQNVKLFDFGVVKEITHNANNYRDLMHYSSEINSWMLQKMHDDEYRMTRDNQQYYLTLLDEMITEFDWNGEYQRLNKLYNCEQSTIPK